MQLKGGQQVTLTPGQTFYEGPDDVHVVDRNASGTNPAKFLVFLIKDKGAPALVPVDIGADRPAAHHFVSEHRLHRVEADCRRPGPLSPNGRLGCLSFRSPLASIWRIWVT
jgi:hypothetical protein